MGTNAAPSRADRVQALLDQALDLAESRPGPNTQGAPDVTKAISELSGSLRALRAMEPVPIPTERPPDVDPIACEQALNALASLAEFAGVIYRDGGIVNFGLESCAAFANQAGNARKALRAALENAGVPLPDET
jgi:hypothetical protein